MRLTLHADYALRVLLFLGSSRDERVSTATISRAYGISKNHLVKVVAELGRAGVVDVVAGRHGGLRLARDPRSVTVGGVLRLMEPDFDLVECLDPLRNTCPIAPMCGLKWTLSRARDAFFSELDRTTLEDLLAQTKGEIHEFLSHSLVRSKRAKRGSPKP